MELKKRPRRLRRLRDIWTHDRSPRFFLTLCVEGRRATLDNEVTFSSFVAFLLNSPARYRWWPRCFVLMPDHVHLIAWQGFGAVPLGKWIKAMKAVAAGREIAWQTGFFDHLLRSDESEAQKWEYIRFNPVRAGLVAKAEHWPYGGEILYEEAGPQFLRVMENELPPCQGTRPTRGARM